MPNKNWTTSDIPLQTGKLAFITGATGGLGYETALALAKAGATVILGGRNEEKAKVALDKIRALVPDGKIEFGKVDHCSLTSIAEFAANISARYQCLDVLINNAGIGHQSKRQTSADGFEIIFGTNHLSHFALTAHLLPLLRKSASPRVVNVSSLAHRQGKINFSDIQSEKGSYGVKVYSMSKVANLLFTYELQKQSDARGWGIKSVCSHPGLAKTNMSENYPGCTGWMISHILLPLVSHSAAAGALPTLFAATSPDAKDGGYYGPNGMLELKGAVSPAYVSKYAKNPFKAAKLWDLSVNLTSTRAFQPSK